MCTEGQHLIIDISKEAAGNIRRCIVAGGNAVHVHACKSKAGVDGAYI